MELLQVGQAGVAGAEIVEGDPDPEILDPAENFLRPLVIVEQDILGHLELEQGGREAGVAQDRLDRRREIAGLQLRGRQIDAEANAHAPSAAIGDPAGRRFP